MISLARVALLLHAERAGYRGPDRRGLLPRLEEPAAPRVAAGALAAVVAIPLGGMGALLLVPRLAQASASVGAADVAVVAFAGAGLVLLVRWRLVGEAAVAIQGIGVALAGLLLVPAVPQTGPLPDYVAALQITAVAAVLVLFGASLASPPVRAGLRPLALATWAFGLALALAVPLAFLITRERHEAVAMAAIRAAEALACVLVAGAVLVRGVRGRHLVFVAGAVALLAIAAACAALAAGWLRRDGVPPELPSLFLAAGAAQLLLLAAVDLRATLREVVVPDLRGRRRWAAAESEVDRLRRVALGRRHDLRSMLSAIDGSLMVLGQRWEQLPERTGQRLIDAMRRQVQDLMAMLDPDGPEPRRYDLSRLLGGVAAVHAAQVPRLGVSLERGLMLEGRADRVALAVSNLLRNAAAHAPGAAVTLSARRASRDAEEAVEIEVADEGPGLPDADLAAACGPGWRGGGARGVPGSGLGLFQCRQLVEVEGGEIVLGPTHPDGRHGSRGLRVRIRIPVSPPLRPARESSTLQMCAVARGETPDPAGPDRVVRRRGSRAGARLPFRRRTGTPSREDMTERGSGKGG